jgi:hypothetical protein
VSTAPAPALPGVSFEVERFEWVADDRLEVVGRWFGLRGHRFLRPTLDVAVRGERRRMLALLEHKPWAAEEGEEWTAAFAWAGARARLEDAELTVSPDLAVQLPLPEGDDGPAPEAIVTAAERVPARRPRTAVLEGELAEALAEVQRRGDELAQLRETHSDMTRELRDRARTAQETAKRLEAELEEARERIGAVEEEAKRRLEAAADDSSTTLERMREERDAAAADRNRAEAEAEAARADRDDALRKLAAAEAERAALEEARDRARQERNAWMSRARAAAAEARGKAPIAERVPPPAQHVAPAERTLPAEDPADPPAQRAAPPEDSVEPPAQGAAPPEDPVEPPPAAAERRTIRIGERPGPLRREPVPHANVRPPGERLTPRLIAGLALAVVVVVVVLVLLLGLG